MARKRADSFGIAFDTLRHELRAGRHPAGARLTANDIAGRLALSATPVREALSRLAGEGLLTERRGQGYFIPRLTAHDLASLLRLQREILLIACEGEPAPSSPLQIRRALAPDGGDTSPVDLVRTSERIMRTLAAPSSAVLSRHLVRVQDQLAPVRAVEPLVLDRLAHELQRFAAAIADRDLEVRRQNIREFHDRRIAMSIPLMRRHESSQNIESI